MHGLLTSSITIGSFTSVSRNVLPKLMHEFKKLYPGVNIKLRQGDYTEIRSWIINGEVDFGFINSQAAAGLEIAPIYSDKMVAVLPMSHHLANHTEVSLSELENDPLILLDEGEYSLPLNSFKENGLHPKVEYKIYDELTILAMIQQNIGISLMYKMAIQGYDQNVAVLEVPSIPERQVAIAYTKKDSLSMATKTFIKFIQSNL